MTLLELIVVVAIAACLAAVALPGILGGIHRTGVDGASRRLADDIRLAQASALTRGMQARIVVFDETGVVPLSPVSLNDPSLANRYRIEVRPSPAAAWPALTDTLGSNANVLTAWNNLAEQFQAVAVTTGNAVTFNSLGGLVNSTVPAGVVLRGTSGAKTVNTNAIGKVTIL